MEANLRTSQNSGGGSCTCPYTNAAVSVLYSLIFCSELCITSWPRPFDSRSGMVVIMVSYKSCMREIRARTTESPYGYNISINLLTYRTSSHDSHSEHVAGLSLWFSEDIRGGVWDFGTMPPAGNARARTVSTLPLAIILLWPCSSAVSRTCAVIITHIVSQ